VILSRVPRARARAARYDQTVVRALIAVPTRPAAVSESESAEEDEPARITDRMNDSCRRATIERMPRL